MLSRLADRLENEETAYYMLTGSTGKEKRAKLVEEFNKEDNPTAVFLISLKAGGTGLNLTAADIVITTILGGTWQSRTGDRPCPPDRAKKRSQCLQTDRERYDRRKYCKAAGEKTCPGGSDTEWRGHGKRQFFQRRDSGTAGWQVRIWGNCSEATAKILNSYQVER